MQFNNYPAFAMMHINPIASEAIMKARFIKPLIDSRYLPLGLLLLPGGSLLALLLWFYRHQEA